MGWRLTDASTRTPRRSADLRAGRPAGAGRAQGTRPRRRVVCAGIHMSDIPSFPYELLWEERQIRSVANLTRRDGEEFLELAPRVPVKTEAHAYPLRDANAALDDLAHGRFQGAAVLTIGS